ncbi:MAG: DUF1353 domain-containing protein [Vicinamibacterales bacterium]
MTKRAGPVLERRQSRKRADYFTGLVIVAWQDDGREMRLIEDFTYTDPGGVVWVAPKKAYIDGASIPQLLWSVVGSPYIGKYRNASVVHDIACCEQTRPWKKVHRMFYNACLCGGVSRVRAKVMYAAVYHFGPRWGTAAEKGRRAFKKEQEFDELREFIEFNDPTLEEIESYKRRHSLGLDCFKP